MLGSNLTDNLEFDANSEGTGLYYLQTGLLNVTEYALYGEGLYDESIELSLFLNHTSDFTLSLKTTLMRILQYSINPMSHKNVNNSYSTYNGCFDGFRCPKIIMRSKIFRVLELFQ